MDYSKLTLGELLSSDNKTIRRNAISILKEYQRTVGAIVFPAEVSFYCDDCGTTETWDARTIAQKGTPVCPKCDGDMKIGE